MVFMGCMISAHEWYHKKERKKREKKRRKQHSMANYWTGLQSE